MAMLLYTFELSWFSVTVIHSLLMCCHWWEWNLWGYGWWVSTAEWFLHGSFGKMTDSVSVCRLFQLCDYDGMRPHSSAVAHLLVQTESPHLQVWLLPLVMHCEWIGVLPTFNHCLSSVKQYFSLQEFVYYIIMVISFFFVNLFMAIFGCKLAHEVACVSTNQTAPLVFKITWFLWYGELCSPFQGFGFLTLVVFIVDFFMSFRVYWSWRKEQRSTVTSTTTTTTVKTTASSGTVVTEGKYWIVYHLSSYPSHLQILLCLQQQN